MIFRIEVGVTEKISIFTHKSTVMKKIITILSFLFLCVNAKAQNSEAYYQPYDSVEPILLLQNYNTYMVPRFPNEDMTQEKNYISNGVSNVNVVYLNNIVYISWNVCDDSSNSIFVIKKITNSEEKLVGMVNNIQCMPHTTLLYSLEDKNFDLSKTNVYKLLKISQDGFQTNIITMILPKINNLKTATNN